MENTKTPPARPTPGPWTIIINADDRRTCYRIGSQPYSAGHAEDEANAQLIAAAPELLDALDAITRCVSMAGPAGTTAYLISEERMQKARAALARARGVLSSDSLPQPEMMNAPTSQAICLTCGSEIVETINDTHFRRGECGPCEFACYMACGDLIEAATSAIDYVKTNGLGFGQAETIDQLQSAIARSYATKR